MSKTSKIIMSIHPEYVNKIFSGEKKFEYRKIQPKGWIDTIIIYSTYPVSKIVGEVEFIGYYIGHPETIWKETKEFSGIEKERYFSYYRNAKNAIAFKLGKVNIYDKPMSLNELGINYTPQSFVYLKE